MRITLIVTLSLIMLNCSQEGFNSSDERQIRDVLSRQQEGWNSGSIKEYMQGYAQNDSIRFISGGDVSYGWKTVFERYKKGYTDTSAMGTLAFSDITIKGLGPEQAIVYGKWELVRKDDRPWGRFTLLFEKLNNDWRIVHDHTSVAK